MQLLLGALEALGLNLVKYKKLSIPRGSMLCSFLFILDYFLQLYFPLRMFSFGTSQAERMQGIVVFPGICFNFLLLLKSSSTQNIIALKEMLKLLLN